MFRLKIFVSIFIFSTLLLLTSIIKNETRIIEKKIFNLEKILHFKDKDLKETQLEFSYLSSPLMIEKKIDHLDTIQYITMDYSRIFLSISEFLNLDKKLVFEKSLNEKKIKKK